MAFAYRSTCSLFADTNRLLEPEIAPFFVLLPHLKKKDENYGKPVKQIKYCLDYTFNYNAELCMES